MKTKLSTSTFHQCGKCQEGTIESVVKHSKRGNSWEIKKCDNCKYHYGIKEFSNANLKEI